MSDSSNSSSGLISISQIRPYIKLLLKNWWLIAILAGTGYASARLITHRQLYIYSASTEILLAKDKELDYQNRLGGMLNQQGSRFGGTDTKDQQRILRSFDLVGRAVDKMNLDIDYYLVGRLKTSHVGGFGELQISATPELFNGSYLGREIDLFVEDEAHFRLSYAARNGEIKEIIHPFGEPLDGPDLALTINYNNRGIFNLDSPAGPTVNLEALENARKQHYRFKVFSRAQRINQMRGSLRVNNVMGTNILTLSSSSTLPGRPKTFLNILGEEFVNYTKEARLQSSLKTESFINIQLDELVSIMDSLERMVDGFKAQNEILDLTREQSEFFNALVTLETQERELQFRQEALTSLKAYLSSGLETNSLPPTSYLIDEDPLLIEQVGALYQMRSDRTRALLDVTEDSYQIRRLDSAISNARFTVKRYIEDTRVAISDQRRSVRSQISSLEDRLSGIPATQRDIFSMERKLTVNEKMYVYLLEARAQNVIQRAGIAPGGFHH